MSAKAEKTCRPVGAGGAGDFWGSVNPISTRGEEYAHEITTGTPRFFLSSYGLDMREYQAGPSQGLKIREGT